MAKTNIIALAMMAAAAGSTLYDIPQRAPSRRTVSKCSDCPEFGRRCLMRNGEMKPCSKYR